MTAWSGAVVPEDPEVSAHECGDLYILLSKSRHLRKGEQASGLALVVTLAVTTLRLVAWMAKWFS